MFMVCKSNIQKPSMQWSTTTAHISLYIFFFMDICHWSLKVQTWYLDVGNKMGGFIDKYIVHDK